MSDMLSPRLERALLPIDDAFFVTGPPRRLFAELAPDVDLPRADAAYAAAAAHLGILLGATADDLEASLDAGRVRDRLQQRLRAAARDVARRAE